MPLSTASWTRATTSSETCVMGDVTPPGQHVGVVQHVLRQPVLRLLERRGSNLEPVAERLGEPRRDRAVHAVGIKRPHSGLVAFVDVLAPHGHPHHSFTHI